MTARSTSSRYRGFSVLLTLAGAACSSFTDARDRPVSVAVVLASNARESGQQVSPPFVSVAESVDVVVTSSSGARLFAGGRRLQRYQTEVTLPIEVPSGEARFSGRVLSSNRTILFSGDTTQRIDNGGFSVVIPLGATRPVLLVAPDTARPLFGDGNIRGTFFIHNRGSDTLSWSVLEVDTAFTRCGQACAVIPRSGQIRAQASDSMIVSIPSAPPFSARLFSFVLRSPEGDVTIWWQVTASPVISVVVSPRAVLAPAGQTAQLAAAVQVSGTNVSPSVLWSSSNTPVATVSGSGIVTGVASGSAMITAASVVDATKRDSAIARVYNPGDTPFPWTITAPSSPITISRDDASAGIHTVTLTAQASGATGTFLNPFTSVEFWAQASAAGVWRRIASTPSPVVIDNGTNRFWTYSIVWNPDAGDAPFATPSTNPMRIIAIGITPFGVVFGTPLNSSITITVP